MYRPQWVEPLAMEAKGFTLVSDKDGYLKYENVVGREFKKGYGKAGRGYMVIYFNLTYKPDTVYCGIRPDGDTRTSYGGVVDTEIFFDLLIESVR